MATTILAGLWTRASSSTLNRSPESNLPHLRQALAAHQKRVRSAGITQAGMKGLFVAPEYYFARSETGTWDPSATNFRSRSIEQKAKETIVEGLKKISADFPDIVIIPGSIAWRKPLDRPDKEKYHVNELTGARTGPLKTTDRRGKNFQRIADVGDFGMGGGLKAAQPFSESIIDMINTDLANCGTIFNNLTTTHGKTPSEAFQQIYNDWLNDPGRRNSVITHYGLDARVVHAIPKVAEKAALQATATNMMRNTAYLLYNGKIRFKYNKKGDFHESIGDGANTVFVPGDKLGLTEPIEGVSFGMEICLDHALAMLNTGFPGGKKSPHIHVVVSDHVFNDTANMRARKYYVHASTDASQAGVWKIEGGPARAPAESYDDTVDGGTISYWKLSMVEASLVT